jgi:hypothetical protein
MVDQRAKRRRMPRPLALGLAATIAALAFAQSGVAASPDRAPAYRADRDQVKALRMTVDWLAIYSPHLWIGVEMPGPCQPLPGGGRACPIAIDLRAWTRGELAPWRCDAQVLLPPPGSATPARRTSARCHPTETA